MHESGYQGGSAPEGDIARATHDSDVAYFAAHPDEDEFVRRYIPGEANDHFDDDAELSEAWDDVEWILVTTLNERRKGRIRIPLRAGYPQLTDGARP